MKVGIVGTGTIARKMATTISQMDDVVLHAIASRSNEKAQAFAKEFRVTRAYDSYDTLMKDAQVDLVYIATPHSHHFENMIAALQHNKHVLCEKSFTVNERQAETAIRIAAEKKLLLAEAIWTRYLPMRKSLESVIRTGIIGEVKGITANLGFSMDHVARLAEPGLAGGALLDVGVYTINFALIANKKAIKNIHSAVVFTNKGLDGQSNITLEFIDGSLAMLHSSQVSATDRRGLIFGTKGYIEVRNIVNPEWIRVFDPFHNQLSEIVRPPQLTGFEYQLRSCKHMIEKGSVECPEMPHAEILRVMHIMDIIRAQWNLKYPME